VENVLASLKRMRENIIARQLGDHMAQPVTDGAGEPIHGATGNSIQ
jgi:hypothetical protein